MKSLLHEKAEKMLEVIGWLPEGSILKKTNMGWYCELFDAEVEGDDIFEVLAEARKIENKMDRCVTCGKIECETSYGCVTGDGE